MERVSAVGGGQCCGFGGGFGGGRALGWEGGEGKVKRG